MLRKFVWGRSHDLVHTPPNQQTNPQDRTTDQAILLASARQNRTEYLRASVATLLMQCGRQRFSSIVPVMVLAAMALVVASETSPPWGGVPAPVATLSAVLLAATLSSIAGFAFSAICGAMLLRLMDDPVEIVVLMMVCSIAIQSLSVAVLWRDIDWRSLSTFLVGGVVGLPVGVWLLLHLGNVWFKEAIGGLLTVYAAYRLLKRPLTFGRGNELIDMCVGFAGGITGGFAGFPGAAVTIWCGLKGWDKRRQRGVYQPFILVMQLLALPLIHFMRAPGGSGAGGSLALLQFVPAALLGTWLGLSLFERLSDRFFAMAVNVMLLISGIGLLV